MVKPKKKPYQPAWIRQRRDPDGKEECDEFRERRKAK